MKQYKIENSSQQGQLYIVPTPIGNLSDITQRAITTLQTVDLIAAENPLHTGLLLQHFTIHTRLCAFHTHNELRKTKVLITKLKKGRNIALVSDAGTPLISDPGYHLVRACHQERIRVVPLPGPCAAITALSASGLPLNRFCYEGFLPKKPRSRFNVLKSLMTEPRTLIFYESTHRLLTCLENMISIWGVNRHIVLIRELTKTWETIYSAPLGKLLEWVKEDKNRSKGEIVLIIEGCKPEKNILHSKATRTLDILKTELQLKQAIKLTAKIYDIKKSELYKYIVENRR